MNSTRNYEGKTVYMGIDVHKKTYCCVSMCDNELIKRDTMPADSEKLLHYMRKFFPGANIRSAYEAGFSGFHLHRYLTENGVNNIVVHPASIEVSSRDRVKTDKRDAKKIAVQLQAQRLRGIFVPSVDQEARRQVTRLRTNFCKARTRVGAQLKSLLFTQGLIRGDDSSLICKKWIENKLSEIEEGNHPKELYYAVRHYATEWEALTQKMKEFQEQLKCQASCEPEIHQIYESVPGIGLIHARQLANELGDMSQFRNEKKLFSYTGLTPSEYSSGEHIRQGHITRQGRAVIRSLLVEAAWVAITKDPSLREVYDRLSHRGGKRAIVGVARRLIGRIRSCLLNNKLYEISQPKEKGIAQAMICATS